MSFETLIMTSQTKHFMSLKFFSHKCVNDCMHFEICVLDSEFSAFVSV